MSSPNAPDHHYILPHDGVEQSRLSTQYKLLKDVFGYTTALPDSLDTNTMTDILDVASGTLSWLLDLHFTPHIHARTLPAAPNPIRLHACDITDAKFPPHDELAARGIHTFLQDVTQPFPPHMKNTFDLVHMSAVRFSLTEQGWISALRNIHEILSNATTPLPAENTPHDVDTSLNGTTWLHKLNAIYTLAAQANHYIPDPSYRLRTLLPATHFTLLTLTRTSTPFGHLCHTSHGLAGTPLSPAAASSTENLRLITRAVVQTLLAHGTLQAPVGCAITTPEGGEAVVEEVVRGAGEEGCRLVVVAVVARKEEP